MIQQGYKDTPIGIIPTDWEVVKLGDILEYEQPTKYLIKNDDYNIDYKTPVLTAGKTFILGYTDEINDIYANLPVIIFDDFTTSNHYVNFEFKIKSSAMKLLTTKKHNLKYLYEQMQLIKFCLGIEHKRYWISEYSQIKIPLPPMLEQEKIAEILSTWDEAISHQETLIEQKNIQKKGLMQQIFNQTIRFKDANGNDYPSWQTAKLGDICIILSKTNHYSKDGLKIGNYPFFINNNSNKIEKYLNIYDYDDEVIIANTGGIAHFKYYYGKFATTSDCYIFKTSIHTKFVYFYLIKYTDYINDIGFTGSGIKHLDKKYFNNFKIPLPTIEEQTKIAQFLSAIDEEITTQEKILAQWKLQKQGLMQKLLTGQLRVKI
jgi:type I restriction enzyme S subunit